MSETKQTPQTCRWAQPTFHLPLSCWAEVWNAPWTCVRERPPQRLNVTTECATCPRWEARAVAHVSWTFAQVGL